MIRKLAFHEISQKLPFQGNLNKELSRKDSALSYFINIGTIATNQRPDTW